MLSANTVPSRARPGYLRVTLANDLARLLKGWRTRKGLSRTEAVVELEKLGVEISYGYLNKLESGARSLASASIEIREGIRQMLGIPKEEWEAETGLYVPLDADKTTALSALERMEVAPDWVPFPVYYGSEGQGFESPQLHHSRTQFLTVASFSFGVQGSVSGRGYSVNLEPAIDYFFNFGTGRSAVCKHTIARAKVTQLFNGPFF